MKVYLNPIINAGLGIRSSVFYWFAGQLWAKEQKSESLPSLFCHEWPEWFSHSRSFVKSNWSELLKSFFKKEQMSEEQWEWFTLGHKKGKNCQNMRKIQIFQANRSLFASNLLESWANHWHRSFVKSNMSDFVQKSEEQMSEFPTLNK